MPTETEHFRSVVCTTNFVAVHQARFVGRVTLGANVGEALWSWLQGA
jgi:hypothetical protein